MDLILSRLLPRAQPTTDEGLDSIVLANFWREEEAGTYSAGQLSAQRQAVPWGEGQQFPWTNNQGYIDDEISTQLANTTAENVEGWSPRPGDPTSLLQSVPWLDVTFADESADNAANLANFALEQEENWTPPSTERQPWSANLFGFQDELFFVAADDEQSWPFPGLPQPAPAQMVPWLPVSFRDDEFSTGLANTSQDNAEGFPPFCVPAAFLQAVPWLARVFGPGFEEELFYVAADDELPWAAAYQSRPWTAVPSLDEGTDSTALAYFLVEQEEPAPGWPLKESVPWQAVVFGPGFEEELQWCHVEDEVPGVVRCQLQPWLAVPFGYDETSTSLANFAREQEEFWAAQVEGVLWAAAVFRDEDLYPAQPTTIPVDEELPWVARREALPWLPAPFADEGVDSTGLKFFYLEDEPPSLPAVTALSWRVTVTADEETLFWVAADDELAWVAAYQRRPWLGQLSADDSDASPTTTTGLEDEVWLLPAVAACRWVAAPPLSLVNEEVLFWVGDADETPWTAAYQARPWLARPSGDEEPGTQLAYFFREQEDDWNRQTETVAWLSRPFADEGVDTAALANFPLEQEEPWPLAGLVNVSQDVTWVGRAYRDEGIDSGTLTDFGRDQDEHWTARYQRVPWTAVLFLDEDGGANLRLIAPRKVYLIGIDTTHPSLYGVDSSRASLTGVDTTRVTLPGDNQ